MVENLPSSSFSNALSTIHQLALKGPVKLKEVFEELEGRGYPILLIFLSLPFCLPVTIPGTSTPFGLMMAFMGLRVAFGREMLWPNWLLDKQISSEIMLKLTEKALIISNKLSPYLRPRYPQFVSSPLFRRIHGLAVCILALVLSLPLPFPGTNMLAALPIVCIGLGLLEDDALFIAIGYLIAVIGFVYLALLYFLGSHIFSIFASKVF